MRKLDEVAKARTAAGAVGAVWATRNHTQRKVQPENAIQACVCACTVLYCTVLIDVCFTAPLTVLQPRIHRGRNSWPSRLESHRSLTQRALIVDQWP